LIHLDISDIVHLIVPLKYTKAFEAKTTMALYVGRASRHGCSLLVIGKQL